MKSNELDPFVEFILTHFDGQMLYTHIHNIYDTKKGMEFMKDETNKVKFRNLTSPYGQDGDWIEVPSKEIITFISKNKLDIEEFIVEMNAKLLTKAVYHDLMLKDLIDYLGEENVEGAKESWKKFARDLDKAVKGNLNKPNLEVILPEQE